MTRLRRWAPLVAVAAAVVLLTPFALLAGVDAGLFNRAIEEAASAKTHRAIRFDRLQTHLLSAHPWLMVQGLSVASPPAISREPMLQAPLLTARLQLVPLLLGRFAPREMTLTRPRLHLVRVKPGVNNYEFGGAGSAGLLHSAQHLTVIEAQVVYFDIQRQMSLVGVASQDGRPGEAAPFRLAGAGVIKGGGYTVTGEGAALNGRRAGAPYAFHAQVLDGATQVQIAGTSRGPFDFRGLDVEIRASGPNLAALGYVFGTSTPNSGPFTLTGRVRRSGKRLAVENLVARIGRSDVVGQVFSDHPRDQRRLIRAAFVGGSVYLRDLQALVRPRPSHVVARSAPGDAAVSQGGSKGEISAKPFRTDALGASDSTIDLQAARVPDAPLDTEHLVTRVTWKEGRLAITPLSFDTKPGHGQFAVRMDLARPVPTFDVAGALRGADVRVLHNGFARSVDGPLDVFVNLNGEGRSPRAMAASTAGRLAFRVGRGRLKRVQAAVLGGDLVQAVASAVGDKDATTPLYCAVGEFDAARGRFRASRLDVVTAAGVTTGEGHIDVAPEALALVFRGAPAHASLRVSAVVTVQGPLSHPVVRIGPAPGRQQGGVQGAVSIVTRTLRSIVSPPPAPPTPGCAALLAEAVRYAG